VSDLSDAEERYRAVRHALNKARAVHTQVICAKDPASYTLKVEFRGHFASSPTYNQTEAAVLNEALSEAVAAALPRLWDDVQTRLHAKQDAGKLALLDALHERIAAD